MMPPQPYGMPGMVPQGMPGMVPHGMPQPHYAPAPGMPMMAPGVPGMMAPPTYFPPGGMPGVHVGPSHGHGGHGGHGGPPSMPHKIINPHCHKCHGTGWN